MGISPENRKPLLVTGAVLAAGAVALQSPGGGQPSLQEAASFPVAEPQKREIQTEPGKLEGIGGIALSKIDGEHHDPSDKDDIEVPPPKKKHHHHRVKLPLILKRIGGCESNGSPHAKINYRAENSHSTASGGFQFLDTTWKNFRGYSRAMYAPPRDQKIKAKRTLKKYGTSPWTASRPCWG
jgi:hypothetical protein